MTRKSLRGILLSLAILTLISVSFILPTFERIPYLEEQISRVIKEKQSIERMNQQLEYHLPLYEAIKIKADKSIDILDNTVWKNSILEQIEEVDLKLIKQSSEGINKNSLISEQKLKLVVVGDYKAHMLFYQFINTIENQTILRSYTLKNLELFKTNPTLQGKMELSHFSIKL